MTGGALVSRITDRLRGGPAHTLELARDVLCLTGHTGAASAAVFALLGSDPRFLVDGKGLWSLASPDRVPGPPLDDLSYAVVDVETTGGGYHDGHRIMEIAVVEVHGGAIVDEWQTLVNPGRPVSPFVAGLTGIHDRMLAVAPAFEHVAPELWDRLDGRVFVAHNAAFDWRFVSAQLGEALGDRPDCPRLCTIRMVRRLVPRLRRRNLDAVSRHFGVRVFDRHRAYGDALATARVLLRLLDEAGGRGLHDMEELERFLREPRKRKKQPRRVSPDA
ncbi:MAG: 3'-5' exonuclease [Gemmatimonadetes bacterium]|nr:3'-5' exonuclease [Gemmatimonadota bacterium]